MLCVYASVSAHTCSGAKTSSAELDVRAPLSELPRYHRESTGEYLMVVGVFDVDVLLLFLFVVFFLTVFSFQDHSFLESEGHYTT